MVVLRNSKILDAIYGCSTAKEAVLKALLCGSIGVVVAFLLAGFCPVILWGATIGIWVFWLIPYIIYNNITWMPRALWDEFNREPTLEEVLSDLEKVPGIRIER